MIDVSDPRQGRYLTRAYDVIRAARVADLLQFVSLRAVAGSATARFYDAFPGRREQLLAALQDYATDVAHASAGVTNPVLRRLMRLVAALKDREPDAIKALKQFAGDEFDSYFRTGGDEEAREFVRNVMVAAAANDPEAQRRLKAYYDSTTGAYGELCKVLLEAVDRRPVQSIGSVDRFAIVVSALYDGLGTLARIEGVDYARSVLIDALIPVVVGLTEPIQEPPSTTTEAEMLFGPPQHRS